MAIETVKPCEEQRGGDERMTAEMIEILTGVVGSRDSYPLLFI
jgi:hypothetical protein